MGKIRVKTLGSEELEEKEKKERKTKKDQKIAVKTDNIIAAKTELKPTDAESEKTKDKKRSSKKTKKNHSKKYTASVKLIDKTRIYNINEALKLLEKVKLSRMDETVELHINTTETGISGSVTLPNGTGKAIKVKIASPSKDQKEFNELIKNIEKGVYDFDVLVATPDAMPILAKFARFLGPKGLMPNPKNGTVTNDPETVIKRYEKGEMGFKTEGKAPIIHLRVGKISFGEKKLSENIKEIISAVKKERIKNITLKSTMSPGMKLEI